MNWFTNDPEQFPIATQRGFARRLRFSWIPLINVDSGHLLRSTEEVVSMDMFASDLDGGANSDLYNLTRVPEFHNRDSNFFEN